MVIAVDVDGTLFDGVEVPLKRVDALREARVRRPHAGDRHRSTLGRARHRRARGRRTRRAGGVRGRRRAGRRRQRQAHLARRAGRARTGRCVSRRPACPCSTSVTSWSARRRRRSTVVTEVRDRMGSSRRIVTNKGSIALTPDGVRQGHGAARGDGRPRVEPTARSWPSAMPPNDLPMFAIATIAVAVANADDAVRASGVPMTTASFGDGVAEALRRLSSAPRRTDVRRRPSRRAPPSPCHRARER